MPATNPFPHIADDLWRTMRASPYADDESSEAQEELKPRLCMVTEGDRRRAPIGSVPGDVAVPAPGEPAEIAKRFSAHRAAGWFLEYPTWPICCARPSTLIGADRPFAAIPSFQTVGDELPHYTEAELRADWGMAEPAAENAIRQLDDPTLPEPDAPPRGWRRFFFHSTRWLERYNENRRRARDGHDGTALFQCRACGRYYLGSHHAT